MNTYNKWYFNNFQTTKRFEQCSSEKRSKTQKKC